MLILCHVSRNQAVLCQFLLVILLSTIYGAHHLSTYPRPFLGHYSAIFTDSSRLQQLSNYQITENIEECELPLVDLKCLKSRGKKRRACIKAMGKASSEWGFFQVLNHGISSVLLKDMKKEQRKLFGMPFEKKVNSRILNDSYRWGTPSATSLQQFSWSEAFHVPLAKISEECYYDEFTSSLRDVMEKLSSPLSELAGNIARGLAENLGYDGENFPQNCNKNTCFLRLNRYPPCPLSPETFGLMPHTDSDFLTILYQDQVGGLQLMKDNKWVAVKPNPDALIVNIGDLFQAWSSDIYRSVMHKVMANAKVERYSIAYFMCPSYDSIIGSCKKGSQYRTFTFGDFRKQVQEDVKKVGYKVGLSNFLLPITSSS